MLITFGLETTSRPHLLAARIMELWCQHLRGRIEEGFGCESHKALQRVRGNLITALHASPIFQGIGTYGDNSEKHRCAGTHVIGLKYEELAKVNTWSPPRENLRWFNIPKVAQRRRGSYSIWCLQPNQPLIAWQPA
jgi:hypothetical protein